MDKEPCQYCDSPGGKKTYENQVCMPLNGRVVGIDKCIAHIVAALNAGGVSTFASCCGHGKDPGRIDLLDGRLLTITHDGSVTSENPYRVASVNKAPIIEPPSQCDRPASSVCTR